MRLDPAAKNLITNLLARDVAAGVELARSLGYAMPRDFDIGVRFVEDHAPARLMPGSTRPRGRDVAARFADYSTRTCIRIRLDDAEYDSIVHLPDMEQGYTSVQEKKRMWGAAWERLQADALAVSNVWIDKHPEAATKDARGALSLLERLKADDKATARWMAGCRERAATFTYTTRR